MSSSRTSPMSPNGPFAESFFFSTSSSMRIASARLTGGGLERAHTARRPPFLWMKSYSGAQIRQLSFFVFLRGTICI
jgi:hypothetical protein